MQVILVMTDRDRGRWSIYNMDGLAVENDFYSEEEAEEFAEDEEWEIVETFIIPKP